jgi:CheY-like chemotaxis protein
MAAISIRCACLRAAAALLSAHALAVGQQPLTPEQASARKPGDYAPARLGESCVVRGTVNFAAVRISNRYDHAGIERDGYGLVLEATDQVLRTVKPGDEIEAAGRIGVRGGLAVLLTTSVRVLGRGAAPAPAPRTIEELLGFRHLGLLVTVDGRVIEVGENTSGAYLLIGTASNPYKLFLPHLPGGAPPSFKDIEAGDTVTATGLAAQYGSSPPFNRWFELVVASRGDVVRTGHPMQLPPGLLAPVALFGLCFALIIWRRERHLRAQREVLRRSHELGEEILGASSPQDILRKIAAVVPDLFDVTGAALYVYNAPARSLEKVSAREEEEASVVLLDAPPGGLSAGAATCFQNRMVLAVPDSARSPFPPADPGQPPPPRSVLFVTMFVHGEAVGVFEISHQSRTREFSADQRTVAQHLANQTGVALRLLDQRSVREQLFRTEKLAAVGRLISGVVNELQAPLASICNMAEKTLAAPRQEAGPQLHAIAAEARKASDMVTRLVSFASSEPVETRPVDLNVLLRHLAEFREREWKARGIRVRVVMSDDPLPVLGSEGQLEQVLLDLLVHAEQALASVQEKLITMRTLRLARKALIEIVYTGRRGEGQESGAGALGLGVCRSIILGHGGELRAMAPADADPRFEIELPRASRERHPAPVREAPGRSAPHPLTALVIEPDEAVERHLLGLLTARGYRVVPVQNSDVGLDLAQRLRFDVAFCSVRAPGLNWVELSESLQARVGGFVLLADGYDPELAADFEGENRFVVSKPIDENHLDGVLRRVEGALKSSVAIG